jgi:hypothetical protein
MKPSIIAVAAASMMSLGVTVASAQSSSSTTDVTTGNSPASTTPHKRHVERRVHRRYTTGVDLHSGSHVTPLPDKDELNSKAYIVDH